MQGLSLSGRTTFLVSKMSNDGVYGKEKKIPRRAVVGAVVIGVIAIGALIRVNWSTWQAEWTKSEQTEQTAHSIIAELEDKTSTEDLEVKEDGWGNPIQVIVSDEKSTTDVEVRSSGPDGALGTEDDIVVKEKKKKGWLARWFD